MTYEVDTSQDYIIVTAKSETQALRKARRLVGSYHKVYRCKRTS